MKEHFNITVLGGDERLCYAAKRLSGTYTVRAYGLRPLLAPEGLWEECPTPEEALDGTDAVLLPLPASLDGTHLNMRAQAESLPLRLSAMVQAIPDGARVLGGRMDGALLRQLTQRGLSVTDYYEEEGFVAQNAYTTAEAALSIVMNRLPMNVREARIAITGSGRIAKHLFSLLRALGVTVTVAARNEKELALVASMGAGTLSLEQREGIERMAMGFDVIFNTVPHWIFDRAFLERLSSDTFLVDLASAPGGVDIGAAKELGANVLWATSLPGKYAPQSAGYAIADVADRLIRGEGVR